MSSIELRREIKKAVDRIPPARSGRLRTTSNFSYAQRSARRLSEAEKAIKSGNGGPWRKVRQDV